MTKHPHKHYEAGRVYRSYGGGLWLRLAGEEGDVVWFDLADGCVFLGTPSPAPTPHPVIPRYVDGRVWAEPNDGEG